MFRGLNPQRTNLADVLAYLKHRPDLLEEQQNLLKEALADVMGGG